MLTLRVATVGLQFQAEIAQARAFLTPFGALALLRHVPRSPPHESAGFHSSGGRRSSCCRPARRCCTAFVWSLFLNGLDPKTYKMTLETIAYQSLYWYLFISRGRPPIWRSSYSITTREHERRFTALVAEAQEAKIRALRYQINPHFLFNALNSIAELIAENREQAEKMVLNLSEFFRTSLADQSDRRCPPCRRNRASETLSRHGAGAVSRAAVLFGRRAAGACRRDGAEPASSSRWSRMRSSTGSGGRRAAPRS